MLYTYTIKYYSVVKNKIMLYVGKCRELEVIMLIKIKSDKYAVFSLICVHIDESKKRAMRGRINRKGEDRE